MEEYVENEEEAIQELQSGAMQEEEQEETRTETKQPTEETRKRKRGVEEIEIEQRKENQVNDFVLERAYFTWKEKFQYKDFIGERGFSKLILPFLETIEKRG